MKRLLPVILLAGCPDPDPGVPDPPPVYDPHGQCVGFGVSFRTMEYADDSYFSYSPTWSGAVGEDVKPIAVGGVENINVYGPPGSDSTTPRFVPAVTGPVLGIDPKPLVVTAPVVGVLDGVADLCIYDVGHTELHSGVRLAARSVTSMRALPMAAYYWQYETLTRATTYPFDDWRMFVGKRRGIAVALLGDDDWRLVDQGMNLEVALDGAPFVAATREQWDGLSVDVDHASTAHVRATLRSGDVWQGDVTFVDRVDHVTMQSQLYEDLTKLQVGGSWMTACFDATVGGVRVVAAPFEFSAPPALDLVKSQSSNCIQVHPIDTGSGVLTAKVGDLAIKVPFSVAPP